MKTCDICGETVTSLVCCWRGCKAWLCLECWGSLMDNQKCGVCQDEDRHKETT